MACWRKHDDFSIHVFLAITSYSFQTSSIVYSRWLDMRASKSYTLSHWVCWAVFQLLGYRWQLDPRSESRNLSLHRHKKHSTRSVWKGQSASIWVYLNFDAQAKSSSSSEVVKIMSLPATSLQVTAHGFRTSTRFWRFYLPGFMAPAARPDESKSVQVTKLSNQCGTEMLFWKIFHIVLKDFI